ncbi:hypothetical protein IFT62_16850 [Pseudomonas lutea]|uniref:Integrase n=1 Tax=Pseudomonas lutea TaxID=243924 RepID=A0ABR9AC19_9PSED|nr:hypothetical protein [Pseudomonas lutea]MBD8122884.1 hypothetical protein [Pseudomonas lutea]
MKDEPIDSQVEDAALAGLREATNHCARDASALTQPETDEAGSEEAKHEDRQKLVVPVIYGTNGQPVTCTYMNHPAWAESTNICMTLHFIMLTLGPVRSASWCFQYRKAVQYFLDFMADYNGRNPSALRIVHIRDITPSTLRSFGLFLDKAGKSRVSAAILKSAIRLAAQQTDAVPKLELPVVNAVKGSSAEPLSEEGVATLTLASQQVVDAIRETIERRKVIDAAEPYTFAELQTHLEKRFTKRDILTWVKYKVDNQKGFGKLQALVRVSRCDDPEMVELRTEHRLKIALTKMLAADPTIQVPPDYEHDFRKLGSWNSTILDPYRVVKTFNDHGFPFKYSAMFKSEYSGRGSNVIEDCDDVIKLLLNKLYHVRVGFNCFYGERGQYMMSMDEHLALYYPTGIDMVGLAALMTLQAGWNKEAIMGVDKDNFEHPLTSTVEETIKIITSEKFRGQGSTVPYSYPKQVLAASDAGNPYSFYNLILLAKEFTAALSPYLNGVIDPIRNRQVNTLFAYIRPWSGWAISDAGNGTATLDYYNQFSLMMSDFLEKYEVIDNGKRLTSASEITRRLRVSWLFYNTKSTSFAFLSQLMGHQSRDTTDQSYDNSPKARARRLERLRSALESIVALLRARKFKGLLGRRASALANTKLSIFFLPHLERALWACGNRYKPDWPGAPSLPKGTKCIALEQCLFCSRVWILEDSLPYMIERLAHIDELLRVGSAAEFGSRLEAERDEITAILDEWPDEAAIEEALQYRTENSPLLPRNMRDLRLIFKTGDLDE